MGAEQDRRDQQRETDQRLQAALAKARGEGGQAVVVAQGVPGTVAVEARQ